MSRRKRAARLAYVAGLLLLVSNTTGSAIFERWLLGVLGAVLPPALAAVVGVATIVVSVLAGLGGFTVIAGGWVVEHRSRRFGALLIALGTGLGLVGLLANVGVVFLDHGDVLGFVLRVFAGFGGLGVLLSVVAQVLANPPPIRRLARRARRAA